jgi:D-glycero-alpha-D-manno-heptose 1-phosphate guanylyltransferase
MEYLNKPVIILAGGFGTRLQGVLKGLPKPLANIKGRPFISFLIEKLITEGYNNFIFSLFYESEKIIEFIEKEKRTSLKKCSVQYCIEPKPLGTGGAVSFAVSKLKINGYFLVVNADTILEYGYKMIGKEERITIGLVKVDNMSRYGKVTFDDSLLVQSFNEKKEDFEPGYINAGIYNLNSQLFCNNPEPPFSLENHLFVELVAMKCMYAVLFESSFIDIGVPDDYYKFCSKN